MRTLAQRLISEEDRLGKTADKDGRAAFRVCDKLRESLSAVAGVRGFRTLLLRALTLAKADIAWLGRLEIEANGALVFPVELERELEPKEKARGGAALVTCLVELLETLVGEAMTRHLAQQIWPKALSDSKSKSKK